MSDAPVVPEEVRGLVDALAHAAYGLACLAGLREDREHELARQHVRECRAALDASLSSLVAENARLREDAARLDWLEERCNRVLTVEEFKALLRDLIVAYARALPHPIGSGPEAITLGEACARAQVKVVEAYAFARRAAASPSEETTR